MQVFSRERQETVRNVPRDPTDLRDQIYTPNLRPLLPALSPSELVLDALKSAEPLYWLPRNQGVEGTCSAQALASLIDLQRMLSCQDAAANVPVSARMLYEMARLRESADGDEGLSLREVIKGFYHHGVCSDDLWKYEPGNPCGTLNVRRAKAAREVSLGAYYRLRPSLNDYHAALNEVGPVLVSAATHTGWNIEAVRANEGKIIQSTGDGGGHAFVVVGYDSTGFLVLNSWGTEWGSYLGCNGLGHWSYQDWADNIFDGWVLRLGVSTPGAFDLSIGNQGIFFARKPARVAGVPGYEVLGHLIHLDDGEEVKRAPYPYSAKTFDETVRFLSRDGHDDEPVAPVWTPENGPANRGYRGILLRFGGSLLGLGQTAQQIAREKNAIKQHGLYPLTIVWCNDFIDQTTAVLSGLFTEATKQIDVRSERLDRLIEDITHGIGRSFWRDVESASRKSAASNGPVDHVLECLLRLDQYSLHILCDGAGVLLFRDLIERWRRDRVASFRLLASRLASLDFITPTIDAKDFADGFTQLISALPPTDRTNASAVALHVPDSATDGRLTVGMYSKSILDLIEKAFSDRSSSPPPVFIGKSLRKTRIDEIWRDHPAFSKIRINEISIPPRLGELLQQEDLQLKTDFIGQILNRIAPVSDVSDRQRGRTRYDVRQQNIFGRTEQEAC
ncbi:MULTISPECIES: C1 family peptidase [unclassified Sinorhizobium]|uniref:C1 family peptidase n=1 Tax=unclassified Sinorhizobium TaxID=2613772 RepID=UPI0024C42AE5|nr:MULTISPECIES: C1 family peptidase [unclassified Sinorhizobium]MDK1374564.1 C1 family peptidase [Sinorhizobium sp. 6-70]MDK1478236.1 C1 family peptidase [Sinorhizobium sp. 6-117]